MSQRRVPPEVYWRRRFVVLAVLLLLAWVVLQVLERGSADQPAAEPTATTPTTVATTTAPTDGQIAVDLAAGTAACDPEKTLVTPSVRAKQHAGGPITVSMLVSTTDSKPCVLNAKAADLLVVISANKKPVWDSSVCKSALLTGPVSVSPKWATVVQTTWSGRGSGKKCSPKEGFASAGSYVIKSATLGGEIGKGSFHVDAKPKPKAVKTTATPKPTATPSATSSAKPTD